MRTTSNRTGLILVWVIAIVGFLALVYVGRVAYLSMIATEGDVPGAADIAMLDGREIVRDDTGCGSGGCWATFWVSPREGESLADLGRELGTERDEMHVPGSFWDPRTISIRTRIEDHYVVVSADYWSQSS